jgi:hypothetical protein
LSASSAERTWTRAIRDRYRNPTGLGWQDKARNTSVLAADPKRQPIILMVILYNYLDTHSKDYSSCRILLLPNLNIVYSPRL